MTGAVDHMKQRAQGRVGQVLRGKWRLDELIGVGGMASVFAATHRNKKRGAVKLLHAERSIEGDAKTRFLREGYVANNVAHPGVVSVLDDDVAEDGSVFLVMELLEGQSVEAIAASRPAKRLEVGEVLAIADELCDVLAVAHDKGIVHRDLKPDNLFITTREELKVLDFGIARLREFSGAGTSTVSGEVMGTPAYMPPEQASGRWDMVDGRSDLWAVGATMFTLLTGRLVHEVETVQLLMAAAMTRPATPLASIAPAMPPGVCAVVDRALAFSPANRWQDARSMQRAIRELRRLVPAARKPASMPTTALEAARAEADRRAAAVTASPVSHDPDGAPRSSRASLAVAVAGALLGAITVATLAWVAFRPAHAVAPDASSSARAAAAAPLASPASPSADESGASAPANATATSAPEASASASAAAPATDEPEAASAGSSIPRKGPPRPARPGRLRTPAPKASGFDGRF